MSLLSLLQSGVSLSSLTAFLLSTFVLNSKCVGGQAVIPEVLPHAGPCSQVYLSGPRKILTSPGYPVSYHNNTSCQWHILAGQDEIITVSFDDIDIEENIEDCDQPPCCTHSWVKIGPGNEDRFCGQSTGLRTQLPSMIAKSGPLWIKFHTAYRTRGGRGFKLTFVVGKRHREGCAPDEFQCADQGNCILAIWKCNKRFECLDESDEKNCPKHCTRSQLHCESGHQCYDPSQRCDGYMDCADFSDELNCGHCGTNLTACGASPHVCYNPYLSRCNRVLDCPNGEDEQGCSPNCHPRKIPCSSGSGCYSMDERCNGVAQCSDASDEKNCRSDLCRSERGGFLCRNRHCIRETWRCDRTNDCGDESDEMNCLRNSVIAAAVIGSLICGLLLIIAISCSCKLYALRHSDTHSSGLGGTSGPGSVTSGGNGSSGNGETPMSRLEREFMYREPPPAYAIAVGGMGMGPQWGDCPPPRIESRPRRSRRRTLRHEQHRRSCQPAALPSCSSPTTGESSVASTSSSASSPSALSVTGENPSGLTSPNQILMEPSTSQSRKKSGPPAKRPGQAVHEEAELKLEMSGGDLMNSVEMTSTSDVVPLLP